MRNYRYLAAAAAVGLAAVAAATPASAATGAVLTVSSVGGTNVTVNDVLAASLVSGTTSTFYDANSKGVACTGGTFAAKVTANPTVGSGDATESVTSLAFTGCTSNISGVSSVRSITIDNLPYSGDVNDSTDAITITGSVHATIVLGLVIGTATCKYTGPTAGVVGSVSTTNGSLNFSNQAFTKDTGSWSGCPTPENFTAAFGPVTDTSVTGSPDVYIN